MILNSAWYSNANLINNLKNHPVTRRQSKEILISVPLGDLKRW